MPVTGRGYYVVYVFILFFVVQKTNAQDSLQIIVAKNFTAIQDTALYSLLDKYKAFNKKRDVADGYRVQIMYTDIRDDAYKSKGAMYREFPELTSYVEYEQPYYKLRLGDFKTRLDATYYLQQIILLYPGAFIVKDKIKMK